MTDEKKHVDLSTIEPVVHGRDPEDGDSRETGQDVDRGGRAAASVGGPPAVALLPETDDKPPPDPDDLDRLRRG